MLKSTCLIAVFLSCFLFVPLFSAEPIEVLSINVRLSTANDGGDSWANRKEFMMSVVKDRNYDFIGGQEVVIHPNDNLNQVKYMSDNLPGYGCLYLCREKNPNQGEGAPVFYRKDRWEPDAADQGTYWLSDTPDVPGSVTWEGQSTCPRVVTGALFHEIDSEGKRPGKSLYVYATHLDHVGELARQKSAALIFDRFEQRENKEIPMILLGDFNCGERSPVVRFVKGETVELGGESKTPTMKMLDTFRVVLPEEKNVVTFNSFRAPRLDGNGNMIGEKIDYIFVTPHLKTTDAEIIRTNKDGRYPTDHFPIRATVEFAD